jgi:hypothetical protein
MLTGKLVEITYLELMVRMFSDIANSADLVCNYADQSLAMTIAIKENLKSTNHRWCKWHILRKAQEALGHVHKLHSTFSDDFNKVVNHMLTPEEFESGWDYLTKKYDLAGNPFMTRAFEVREKWAKPYFNDIFVQECQVLRGVRAQTMCSKYMFHAGLQ